jgi:hypothetical protein
MIAVPKHHRDNMLSRHGGGWLRIGCRESPTITLWLRMVLSGGVSASEEVPVKVGDNPCFPPGLRKNLKIFMAR